MPVSQKKKERRGEWGMCKQGGDAQPQNNNKRTLTNGGRQCAETRGHTAPLTRRELGGLVRTAQRKAIVSKCQPRRAEAEKTPNGGGGHLFCCSCPVPLNDVKREVTACHPHAPVACTLLPTCGSDKAPSLDRFNYKVFLCREHVILVSLAPTTAPVEQVAVQPQPKLAISSTESQGISIALDEVAIFTSPFVQLELWVEGKQK